MDKLQSSFLSNIIGSCDFVMDATIKAKKKMPKKKKRKCQSLVGINKASLPLSPTRSAVRRHLPKLVLGQPEKTEENDLEEGTHVLTKGMPSLAWIARTESCLGLVATLKNSFIEI